MDWRRDSRGGSAGGKGSSMFVTYARAFRSSKTQNRKPARLTQREWQKDGKSTAKRPEIEYQNSGKNAENRRGLTGWKAMNQRKRQSGKEKTTVNCRDYLDCQGDGASA